MRKSEGLEIDLKRDNTYGVGRERTAKSPKAKTAWAKIKEKWKRTRTNKSLKEFAAEHGVSK